MLILKTSVFLLRDIKSGDMMSHSQKPYLLTNTPKEKFVIKSWNVQRVILRYMGVQMGVTLG